MIIIMTSILTGLYFDDVDLKNEVLTDKYLTTSRRIASRHVNDLYLIPDANSYDEICSSMKKTRSLRRIFFSVSVGK